jgi:hypothetical protein
MKKWHEDEFMCSRDCNNSLTDCGSGVAIWIIAIGVMVIALCG